MRYGLTFDDVLLVPKRSGISSRQEINLTTRLTKRIALNIPFLSANMDTVTESRLAIALAREGGLGVIHRFLTIEDQAREVEKVKRAEQFVIDDPYFIGPNALLGDALALMKEKNVTSLMVVKSGGELNGILTQRDTHLETDLTARVKDLMTPKERLITGRRGLSMAAATKILREHRLEKLPLVDAAGRLAGLITSRDIYQIKKHALAVKDAKGRLLVGATIGVQPDWLKRAKTLIKAGADVLVLDIAHGHLEKAMAVIKSFKKAFLNQEIIGGNVATAEATLDLIKAGADAIKVGVGPGSACITRLVAGVGVPQLTAIMDCAKAARTQNIPVIADGGLRQPGDIAKAIGAGADTIMSGFIFAGTEETPGQPLIKDGRKYKVYRGMASLGAGLGRNARYQQDENDALYTATPEGVEALVNYRGTLREAIKPFVDGLRSGMSYTGARTIKEFHQKAEFIEVSQASQRESGSHDILKI